MKWFANSTKKHTLQQQQQRRRHSRFGWCCCLECSFRCVILNALNVRMDVTVERWLYFCKQMHAYNDYCVTISFIHKLSFWAFHRYPFGDAKIDSILFCSVLFVFRLVIIKNNRLLAHQHLFGVIAWCSRCCSLSLSILPSWIHLEFTN